MIKAFMMMTMMMMMMMMMVMMMMIMDAETEGVYRLVIGTSHHESHGVLNRSMFVGVRERIMIVHQVFVNVHECL